MMRTWTPKIPQSICSPSWSGYPKISLLENVGELAAAIYEYRNIFSSGPYDMEQTDLVTHTIDTGEHRPIRLRPRGLPITKQYVEKAEVQKMLKHQHMAKTSHSGNAVTVLSPLTLHSSTVCNCHIILLFSGLRVYDICKKLQLPIRAHWSWTQPSWLCAKLSLPLPAFQIGHRALQQSLQWTHSLKNLRHQFA